MDPNREIGTEIAGSDLVAFLLSPFPAAALPHLGPAERPSRLADGLLAVGLLLTTASQFRLGGMPIGLGELCLLSWLAYMLTLGVFETRPSMTPALAKLIAFWAVVALSQSLGFLVGLWLDFGYDSVWLLHDVFAYPLLTAVTCLSVFGPDAQARQHRVCCILVTLGALALSVQIAVGWEIIDITGFQPWFWERFRGWSSNPNQFALLCGVLGTLSLHLADVATRPWSRFLAVASAIPAIVAGRMTGSDTFSLALLAAGPIYLGLKLLSVVLHRQRARFMPTALLQILLLSLPLAITSIMPIAIGLDAGALLGHVAKDAGKDVGEESDLRLMLWQQAIGVGFRSGMLGVGPGPHLEIPASIVAARRATLDQPENLSHPEQRISAPNFEAHNSFFDLLTQGGIVAVLSFAWILLAAGINAFRTQRYGLVTTLSCLTIYCLTGLYIRHPIFWFTITLCLIQKRDPESICSRSGSGMVPEPPPRVDGLAISSGM